MLYKAKIFIKVTLTYFFFIFYCYRTMSTPTWQMKTTAMCSRSLKSWMNITQNIDSWKPICLLKREGLMIFLNFIHVWCHCLICVGWRCKFRIWNSLWIWSSCYKSRKIKAISKIWSLNSVSRSRFTWKQRFLRLTKSAFGLEWVNILNKCTWITYFLICRQMLC